MPKKMLRREVSLLRVAMEECRQRPGCRWRRGMWAAAIHRSRALMLLAQARTVSQQLAVQAIEEERQRRETLRRSEPPQSAC